MRLLPLVLLLTHIILYAEPPPPSLTSHLTPLKSPTPGLTLEIPYGTYTTAGCRTLEGLRGTEAQPITLRAAHRGKVTLTGDAGFIFRDCQHLVIEGFIFAHDADQQSIQLDNCQHVRITRNVFRPTERAKPRHWEHWVTVDGARSGHNRIDHNRFEKKVNRGSPLFIRGDDTALVCSQHDRIDHNHFLDTIYANKENGHETIRTGGNDLGASGRSSYTLIEYNLLERCSGEDEIISLKSSDNILRHNTLINCRGAICFRLGNRSTAINNIIIATEPGPAFGGIKLYGYEHRVQGNYFSGLTGAKHEAPFSLFPGMHATPTTENIRDKYHDNTATAATKCIVENNTWLNCAPLQLGLDKEDKQRPHLPTGNMFNNNTIVRDKPVLDSKGKPAPLINFGLAIDTEAKNNAVYCSKSESLDTCDLSEAPGFTWREDKLGTDATIPLGVLDVGPDAIDQP